tara:strand:+ start:20868 stop:21647 length:780 start_codon:yes stop_codon:yes gene_type:complete
MRPKVVAGNWKMNGDQAFSRDYIKSFKASWDSYSLKQYSGLSVVIIPPAILIPGVQACIDDSDLDVLVAGQNVAGYESGAYTGEISASMLHDFSCKAALVGHSERRALFGDTDNIVIDKVKQLLARGLGPILCLGESLEEREQGLAERVVKAQLEVVLDTLEVSECALLSLAYEPVWAIGTGKTATPEEAQAMHEFIRQIVADKSVELAEEIVILYGGSVNSANADSLFRQKDIDGALVGGASLKPDEFAEICHLCGRS